MKCVKKGDLVERVSNDKAHAMVSTGEWAYCPKNKWRRRRGNGRSSSEKGGKSQVRKGE